MSEDKQFIKQQWINPAVCRTNDQKEWFCMAFGPPGTVLLSHGKTRREAWSAAAAFSRERLEEIRQVKEEIAMLCDIPLAEHQLRPMERIVERERSALSDLQRGMRVSE